MFEKGHFSERDAALLIKDILGAINYCHTVKKIVHRDLKPENFLYQNESEKSPIKIIDFGLSRHDDGVMGIMNTKVILLRTATYYVYYLFTYSFSILLKFFDYFLHSSISGGNPILCSSRSATKRVHKEL